MSPLYRVYRSLLLLILVFIPAKHLRAAEFQTLEVAFQGAGRVGHDLPLHAEVTGLTAGRDVRLTVTASDPRGNLVQCSVARATADSQGTVSLTGVFRIGRLKGNVLIAVRDAATGESLLEHQMVVTERQARVPGEPRTAGTSPSVTEGRAERQLISELFLLRHGAHCFLSVGDIAGLADLEEMVRRSCGHDVRLALLNVQSNRQLPNTRSGLESVDLLLLTDDFQLTDNQFNAVREWVLTGGHLLISSGSTVDSLLQTRLGEWLQPHFGILPTPVSIRELSQLQNYVSGAVQLQTFSRAVPMARLNSEQLRVVVDSLEGPIVARTGIGGGTVTCVALDLNRRPLNSWKSLDKFYSMLVYDRLIETASQTSRRGGRISSTGISDLSTQLAASFDAIPARQRWSSWHVMGMMAVYLLIVGPLDYLLVVHLLRAPQLTWITFPVIAATGCGFVYWQFADQQPAFTQRQIHIMDATQADGEQIVFARSLASISTSETRRTDVTASAIINWLPSADSRSHTLRWAGRAEDVYGGMYREGGAGLGRQTYDSVLNNESAAEGFVGVPALAGGSQSFQYESLLTFRGSPLFESGLSVSGMGLLEGDMVSRLPLPISNWVVLFGSRVYQPVPTATGEQRTIRPGQVWNRRNAFVRASDLKSWLNGTRIIASQKTTASGGIKGDSMQVTTPYNVRGTDPVEILTMVSLYDFAGGDAYVGLNNDSLRRMEVSDTIRMNYALLIGTIDQPLAAFQLDGHADTPVKTETVVRLLLPVVRQQAAPPAAVDADTQVSVDNL